MASDKKAEAIEVLDMGALVTYTDYFVILSGTSTQHAGAIADHIEEGMRARGTRPIGVEGRSFAHWVLLDYGDVIVHVFVPETREFYELDKLWLDAPRVGLDEDKARLDRENKRKVRL